ncbi:putative neuropeptides capa receptor-like [Penaeus vannamei]|uniref:Putative neuropeptides capa receptor-like n=1 Tax=Penaeus vannamei TaxID=6689 RepID=A0A3R7SQ77_PENVA|nr:putative neuropeptides capa receptor-like [Penaeus vannamei]
MLRRKPCPFSRENIKTAHTLTRVKAQFIYTDCKIGFIARPGCLTMGKPQGCLKSHAVRSILLMVITAVCFARPCSSLHNHGNDIATRNRVSDRLIANRILPPMHFREKAKGSHQRPATNNNQHQQITTSPKAQVNRSVFSSLQRPPTLPDSAVLSALPSRRLLSTIQDQIQTDDDLYKFIAIHDDFLILCNHPPPTFSNKFFYNEHPEKHGLNGVWNFLPFSCRVGEVCLIVLVACVATGGVVGNLMVIVVLLRISSRNEESNMLRLSLAVADFLTCAFVVLPSLYEHVKPFLTPTEPIIVHRVEEMHDIIPGETVDRTDVYFPLRFFQGLTFASCSIVSLLTLFLLSAERFVMTGRGLMYKHYITPPRVRQAMVISWVIGWVNSSLMTIFGRTVATVTWMTFVKIPIGLSNFAHEDLVVYTCYIIQIFLLSISIPATVLLSILSIKNFVQEQNRVRESSEGEMALTTYAGKQRRPNTATETFVAGFCRVNAKARAAADTWWCICKGMRPVKIECLNYGLQDSDSSRARTPHISNINPPCGVVSGRGMVPQRLRLWLRK